MLKVYEQNALVSAADPVNYKRFSSQTLIVHGSSTPCSDCSGIPSPGSLLDVKLIFLAHKPLGEAPPAGKPVPFITESPGYAV
jgi:hypothetical protein